MEIKFYIQENDKSALECGKIIINNISTLQEFKELYKTEYLYYNVPFKNFSLNETYYMIADDNILFGVFSMHKGYTFIDCMEHDERVIVKQMFPHLKCNIINEKSQAEVF